MQSTALEKSSIIQVSNAPLLRLEVPSMTTLQGSHLGLVIKRGVDQPTHVSPAQQNLYLPRSF